MSEPIVSVKQGRLRGRIDRDYDGCQYFSFLGIPYAKPPLGELRFKAPQPPEPWEGTRDATEEAQESVSRHLVFGDIIGSEDCLKLNVFTPQLPTNRAGLKPVMVWIHGGGFTQGSSKLEMYSPEFLICHDVVIVTINYRLGVLGFLSLEDPKLGVPGNAGLKDMVMALRWVKENIQYFNGDPENVTIFGESAGGAAVHLLVLSPMARNLFHRAIAQSGCATNIWASGLRCGLELAGYLGYSGSDEEEALRVLRKATPEEIMMAQEKCKDPFNAYERRPHGPVVETFNPYEMAFLPDTPKNIMESGHYNKVPFLLGFTSQEGLLFEIMEQRAKISHKITDFEKAVPFIFNLPHGSPVSRQIGARIKDFYYGDEEPTQDNVDCYYRLQTDNFFLREIYSTVKYHVKTSNAPVYFYRFSLDAKLNLYKLLGKLNAKGAAHADDLGYLFKTLITPTFQPESIEDLTIKRMTKLWTNFARTGNPTPSAPDALLPITWPPAASEDDLKFLEIGENLSVGSNPEAKRMQFWDEIFRLNPALSKL